MFSSVQVVCLTLALIAADVWTDPYPGIRYLHRSTNEPKEIHALVIDLSRPELSLRSTKSNEKGRTTTSFSNLVGAAAAVNGDFYNTNGTYDPVGLAIGDGNVWSDDTNDHRFIACTAAGSCEIETANGVRNPDPSWIAAVGGNTLLVNNGAIVQSASDDTACGEFCTTQHPRTAAGVSADGRTLILAVVEGRQTPILGMTTARLAELMFELGAHVAINLDGGGSSAMVVDGMRVSGRPANEPSERSVANHLAIIYDPNRATTGRLVGFVRENDVFDQNAGLQGARVVLSTGEERVTDARGFYEFLEVAAGDVGVDVTLDGFAPAHDVKTVMAGTTNWKSMAMVRAAPDAGIADLGIEDDAGVAADAGTGAPVPLPPDAGELTDAQSEDAAIADPLGEPPVAEDDGCVCVRGARSFDARVWAIFAIAALSGRRLRRRGARGVA